MALRYKLEDACHMAIVEYLRNVLPMAEIVHVPNEGKRSPFEAARQKRLGLRPGAADLIVFLPKLVVAIEVKRPADKETNRRAGRATDAQIEFGMNLNSMGHPFFIAQSIDDVRHALAALGIETREVVAS